MNHLHCRGPSQPPRWPASGWPPSDKVELGVHLARLPASPLLTELVSNWLLGEVPCIIVPATAATVFLLLQGGTMTEQEER